MQRANSSAVIAFHKHDDQHCRLAQRLSYRIADFEGLEHGGEEGQNGHFPRGWPFRTAPRFGLRGGRWGRPSRDPVKSVLVRNMCCLSPSAALSIRKRPPARPQRRWSTLGSNPTSHTGSSTRIRCSRSLIYMARGRSCNRSTASAPLLILSVHDLGHKTKRAK